MCTTRSLIVSPYLVVSHARPPGSNHACHPLEQPCMPPCPREQPCMPPSNHACPSRSHHACTPPGATMHASLEQPCTHPWSNHTCHHPPSNHACPAEQPHTHPGATMHAPPSPHPPEQPHTPPHWSNHAHPPCGQTDTCKNITFANFVCGR